MLEVEGRVADPLDLDLESEQVSVATGFHEGQVEPNRRHANPSLSDHLRPSGTKTLEELLHHANENMEV